MTTARYVSATEAKSKLASHLKAVQSRGARIVITKRGKPVARLEPMEAGPPPDLFGYMKGTVRVVGDIVAPLGIAWDAVKGRR